MPRVPAFQLGIAIAWCSLLGGTEVWSAGRPNIIVVLCDDLGYGDVQCFHPQGKIPTPHFDRLARQGMIFTDAHSASAVCTPTRYALLTGRYAWRTPLQSGVLGGLSPHLIAKDRMTLASLCQSQGYRTACVGKWHLGLDWTVLPGKTINRLGIESVEQGDSVDYSLPFANGPLAFGFDQYFGIAGSLDMVPYTFLRDDRVTVPPTERRSFPMMEGYDRGQTRLGPAAPGFEASQVMTALTDEALRVIRSSRKSQRPFCLYLAYASPHTPIVPEDNWKGRSGLNPYGDFVMQQDHDLGRLLNCLDEEQLSDNTLLMVTSDNGCSPQANFAELASRGHHPSGPWRGTKADIFEGGHRVPFLVRWPGHVPAGQVSSRLVCQTDWLATCADILDVKLPATAGEDSVSLRAELETPGKSAPRSAVVHHSINGSFAIREGPWKLALCAGSGGWSTPRPGQQDASHPALQLYHLEDDPAESRNVAEQNPEVVASLTALLEQYRDRGRSTPGPDQPNDQSDIQLIKSSPSARPKIRQ